MRIRFLAFAACVACSSAKWTDTFNGTGTRTTSGGIAPLDDGSTDDALLPTDGGASDACNQLASSASTVPIVVTFPGHGTTTETIHVVAAGKSCDMTIDTDTDGVAFSADTTTCAPLIAVGTPSSGTVTASGDTGGPNDLLFQWSYGAACTISDDYALSKQ